MLLTCFLPACNHLSSTVRFSLQALALLNNRFMVRMAEHFAERVKTEPDPVAVAFGLAVSREATQAELADLQAYADKHGLPATCRLIFNLNEFAYIY